VKIFNEIEGLGRRLNPEFRIQPITEGVGRPSQHHEREREREREKEQNKRKF